MSVAPTDTYAPPALRPGIDLFLDKNEGPRPVFDPGALGADELAEYARRYPDASRLTAMLAERVGVEPARLLVTAGGDDAIDRLCRLTLSPERALVIHDPTFEMLPVGAARCGAPITRVPWLNGPFPTGAFIDSIDDRAGLAALVTPNNPTGLAVPLEAARAVADACAARGVPLLLDLAYTEFAHDDLFEELRERPNTVIVRTLSKAWGLAGLRVGYAVADPELIARLRAVGAPYAASAVSLLFAERALATDSAARTVAAVRRERADLAALVRALGARADESEANFVLTRWKDPEWIRDALASLGIAVRAFPARPGLEDALRITCPAGARGFDRLTAALRAAAAPEAVLFDLDGVLADVSRSYRRAIVDTAVSFGVTVTAAEIRAAKNAGNANNDWVLTQRLMQARGAAAPLDEVTRRFEDLYQGRNGAPGLRSLETLLTDRATLDSLARRARLAVVTGRPRSDADRFLQEHGLSDLFPVVVTMEDGPAKPEPAVVRLALERLGVAGAWMLGDTPDDIVAARAAGVVPIAVPAPGDDPAESARALGRAGAARVVSTVNELLELLP